MNQIDGKYVVRSAVWWHGLYFTNLERWAL